MAICPECGGLAQFHNYFGEYKCRCCSWRDDSYNKQRVAANRGEISSAPIEMNNSVVAQE